MQVQVKIFLRAKIIERKLAPGDRLPKMRDLAAMWGTNYFTINKAIKELEKEGLLCKTPRLGTFVSNRPKKLSKIGIYVHFAGQKKDETTSTLNILSALQLLMSQQKTESKIIIDSRPDKERSTPLPTLLEAIEERSIEALIVLNPRYMIMPWLNRLAIPWVLPSSSGAQNGVSYNCVENIEIIYNRCLELGCRSIGWISQVPLGGTYEKTPTQSDYFKMTSEHYNIELRDEWIITPKKWMFNDLMDYGYHAFKSFMELSEMPEMLVLTPDTVAFGSVNAILESKIRIPEDLKIIIHTNKEIEFSTPFPVDKLESSCFNMASGLLNQLEKRWHNKKISHLKLRLKLIKSKEVEKSSILFLN